MQSRPLRAADLVPGRVYLSPSGRLCKLEPPACAQRENTLQFTYLSRRGDRLIDDGFSLSNLNAPAIARMQEVLVVPTLAGRAAHATR